MQLQESDSGVDLLKRLRKRSLLNSCFRFLLCLVLVLCSFLAWWDNFPLQDHYQRFLNRTYHVHLPPPYQEHSKDRVKPNETTELPTTYLPLTVPPTVPLTVPPTVPPTAAPTVPPTVPLTVPHTVPPTVTTTATPTVPPTVPPTAAPTVPPTVPLTVPHTVPPTVTTTATPTVPPTVPLTVPHTVPPTVTTTATPTVPPTVPLTVPHTVPPTAAPTVPPNVPLTAPPTVPSSGLQFHQTYPRKYHFIIDNKDLCKTKTPFLVLMVPVAPRNVAARDAIRQTWGNSSLVQGEVVFTLFMLGLNTGADVDLLQEKLHQENLQHHDLIQSDFMDTYLNLTIKTMVIMDWLATRCPTAAYAMKIDSDMFLNIDNLVIMLQKPDIPKLNYLTGMLMWNRPVIRSKNSKWYVPVEMYPEPLYPTYTLGMGYVFSNDLPEKFVEASKSVKPFNIEDAYIGACMKQLGLSPQSPPDPSQFRAYNTKYNRCEYSKIITYILGSAKELVDYWTDLKRPEPPC